MKTLFDNLTKTQLVVFVCLIFLLLILAVSQFQQFGKDNFYEKYESWDPNNTESIKDQIKDLNREGLELNAQNNMLQDYRATVEAGLNKLTNLSDTNLTSQVIQIQPSLIVAYDRVFYDSAYPEEQKKLYTRISNHALVYAAEYKYLVGQFGYFLPTYSSDFNRDNDILSRSLDINSFKLINLPVRTSEEDLIGLKDFLSVDSNARNRNLVSQSKSKLIDIQKGLLDSVVKKQLNAISNRTIVLKADIEKAKDKYDENKLDINKYAVMIGIPLFIIAALLMYFHGITTSNDLRKRLDDDKNDFNSQDYKIGLSFTLYTISVLLLILTLLILGLAKVIAENTLAALLGTIAGYVLNNATDKGNNTPVTPKPAQPQANARATD